MRSIALSGSGTGGPLYGAAAPVVLAGAGAGATNEGAAAAAAGAAPLPLLDAETLAACAAANWAA